MAEKNKGKQSKGASPARKARRARSQGRLALKKLRHVFKRNGMPQARAYAERHLLQAEFRRLEAKAAMKALDKANRMAQEDRVY